MSPGFPAEHSRDRPHGVQTNPGMAAAHLAAIAQAMKQRTQRRSTAWPRPRPAPACSHRTGARRGDILITTLAAQQQGVHTIVSNEQAPVAAANDVASQSRASPRHRPRNKRRQNSPTTRSPNSNNSAGSRSRPLDRRAVRGSKTRRRKPTERTHSQPARHTAPRGLHPITLETPYQRDPFCRP